MDHHVDFPQPGDLPGDADLADLADAERRAQAAARAAIAGLGEKELAGLLTQTWTERSVATERLVAITEELIARTVSTHMPAAAVVLLREDTSHGGPHGHVYQVLDADENVLMDAEGEDWHNLEWTGEVDEYAWDLHYLGRDRFRTHAPGLRTYAIPLGPPA